MTDEIHFSISGPPPLAGTCYVLNFDGSRNSIFTGELVKNNRENWASKKFTMYNILMVFICEPCELYCLPTCSGRHFVLYPLRIFIKKLLALFRNILMAVLHGLRVPQGNIFFSHKGSITVPYYIVT